MVAVRGPDTVEAAALLERVARAEGHQMSQKGGVSQFCSALGSQCSWIQYLTSVYFTGTLHGFALSHKTTYPVNRMGR